MKKCIDTRTLLAIREGVNSVCLNSTEQQNASASALFSSYVTKKLSRGKRVDSRSTMSKSKTRVYDVASLAKQEDVTNSHTLRVQVQGAKVALMASGSYVASSFNGALLEKSVNADRSKLSFGADFSAIVAKGNKGLLVRLARVSKCGHFALYADSIIALGKFGALSLTAHDVREFAGACMKGESFSIRTMDTKVLIHGKFVGAKSELYASLAYMGDGGSVQFRDIETRKNAHNDETVLVTWACGEDEETQAEQIARLAEFVKTGNKVAKVRKGKAAAK